VSRQESEPELVGIAVEAVQPGGAAVGIVDDVTSGASILLGKRVLVGPLDPCGQCEVCRRGGAAVCPYAKRRESAPRRLRVASRWVVALGDGLELPLPAAAAVAGDVATAYTLYARTGLAAREPVVVLGSNPVARFLVEILRAKGITPTIVAAEGDRDWRDWLLGKGAAVVGSGEPALHAAVALAITAQGLGNRPWRVIATEPGVVATAAELSGPRATLTVLGSSPPLPGELIAREVTIIGVAGPHPDLVVEAAAMCVKGELDLAEGVTTRDGDPTRARVIQVP
jgi:6-hydroxycyclohex-1-ene-1-carbonyl-CoA dehydrogenase